MTDYDPTPEQDEALRLFATGRSLAIEAGAGTGKTSTLILLARSTERRGQYIAFNKAIVVEAGEKFPRNVACSTAHSLAYRSIVPGTRYAERLRSSARIKSTEIADRLHIDPIRVELPGGESKRLAKSYLAGLAMRGVTRFCQSADREPEARHVPYVDGIDVPPIVGGRRNRVNNDAVARALVPAMRRAWADLSSETGSLPFKHDHYLKMWHLSDPRIDSDFILFDEAQDANPVLVDIVRQQTHAQLVWVGDSQQAIYGFTGAVNALATVGAEQTAYLTQSFRFGPAIAEVANGVLSALDARLRVVGHSPLDSRVGTVVEPDAILCRTNATAVRSFLDALDSGLRPHIVGGGRELVAFAKAALDLQTDGWTSHPELACFSSWGEVQTYVEQDEQGGDLQLLVKLIDDFGAETIISALERMPREQDADLVISTAHKSKGREWTSVQLADDFPPTPKEEELRLLYVAVTRAKLRLDVSAVGYLAPDEETAIFAASVEEAAAATAREAEALLAEYDEAEVDHAAPGHDHADCASCIAEAREAERASDDETCGGNGAAAAAPTAAVANWHRPPFTIIRRRRDSRPAPSVPLTDGDVAVLAAKNDYASGRYAMVAVVDSEGELVIQLDA